jgi:hypothetical protein
MWYILAGVVLLTVSGAFGFSRLRNVYPDKSQLVNRIVDRVTFKSLTMDQINILLARLEREEPPEPIRGAMCYEAMAYPAVAEYVCPICGEKTIYNDQLTAFIEWELQGCRRKAELINEYTEFEVILDESMFCDFCSGVSDEEPVLYLRVLSSDSTETVNPVSIHDLMILESFLQGNLYYTTSNDGQEPLQDYSERIRVLLGTD